MKWKTLKTDMGNRIAGYDEQRKQLQGLLRNVGKPGTGGGVHGKTGAGARELTTQERQAYDAKLTQIQGLPDGPQKQAAMKQMQDLASKWGIK